MRLLLAAAVLGLSLVAPAAAQPAEQTHARSCFASSTWRGWSADESGDVLYLRVRNDDVYRVDLTPNSHVRERAGYFLINEVRGTGWICTPLDLDLALSDHHGFRRPLIAQSLRQLTEAEIAALPVEDVPS